ncbi:hypothetical protein GQR60_19650 [Labilibaculum sp. A4]|uniref:hypothetical protein n=1 Tax=Labilibaculum euxinus TaxID=2686357 RepID=UPI000F6163EF|nr:hypothetical protein [Labilibaculum euxinus]MDQ1772628.1 hypothetical protein [Labilibaculum euxinus]MWN78552.1 hypothetical protein [Labilibaculum euxinus]
MKTKSLSLITFILLLAGFCPNTFGQPKLSTNPETIINGKIWIPTFSVAQGKQFFLKKLELNGSFKFNGQNFNNLKFFYDLSKEEIITPIQTENNTTCNIVVNPFFLEEFTVLDNQTIYHFKRGDLIHKKLSPANYYQVFTASKITYVIKRTQLRVLSSKTGSEKFNYIDDTNMYAIYKKELSTIKSKADLIKFFPSQKKEIKQFVRFSKLKINRHNPLDAIPLLIKFDQ